MPVFSHNAKTCSQVNALSVSTLWHSFTQGQVELAPVPIFLLCFLLFFRFLPSLLYLQLKVMKENRDRSLTVVNAQHGNRAEGRPPFLSLSLLPDVAFRYESDSRLWRLIMEAFSQRTFKAVQVHHRLRPGKINARAALRDCSLVQSRGSRLRLNHGKAMVTWLIAGELYGEEGDWKHKAPVQSILFTGKSERAPNGRIHTGLQWNREPGADVFFY